MRNKKSVWYIFVGSILGLTILLGTQYEKQQKLQQGIAEKILRFHVLANSDSQKDQELKEMVRDAIGAKMANLLEGVESKEACEAIVLTQIEEIEQTAEEVIVQQGFDYTVAASIEQVDFPVKTYGSYTFPAGKYDALEVTIGEGEGHNWWCVMYPNMCFSGSVYEVVDETSAEELRQVLTKEEYQKIFSENDFEIRLKYLSFLQGKNQ